MLCSEGRRNRNANAQMPSNLPSFDEDGVGAHQGLTQTMLGHVCATDRLIKNDERSMEFTLKLGDMRA